MSGMHKFECGCQLPIVEPPPAEGCLPLLDWDIEATNFDCPATWHLLSKGLTKGVFQLESNLGKHWTKVLKPEHVEHMSALGSILRPGSLKAKDEDGVSTTEHYCRRKNGEEQVEYYDESIKDILTPTFGLLIYQEQAMQVAQRVAGFSLQDAEVLRKAIGKKLPIEMAKAEKMFGEGSNKSKVISKEKAEELFGLIKKSQRYSFNKSHAFRYGITGFFCAWAKAHAPVEFFTSWLRFAENDSDPLQETSEIISEAKLFNIEVCPPSLASAKTQVWTDHKKIYFGLGNIKGVGESALKKLAAEATIHEVPKTWLSYLMTFGTVLSKAINDSLIKVGALPYPMPRKQMVEELRIWHELTKKEWAWVNKNPCDNLLLSLRQLANTKKNGGGCATKNRVALIKSYIDLLENPPCSLVDTPGNIAYDERSLLGVSLTASALDECDASQINCTCKDFLSGRTGYMVMGVEIQAVREWKTKAGQSAGKNMAFLTVADEISIDNVCVFAEAYDEFKYLLKEGNTVLLVGQRDKKKDSFIVNKVFRI